MALSFTLSQTFIQIAESKGNTKNADEKAFHTVIYKALAGERWKVCVQVCDDYLAKHKTDPLARALRGYSLIEVSRDAEAAADLTAALAGGVTTIPISIAEDHCNNVLALRGFALLRLGKLKEGIADIEKSLNKSMLLSEYLNQKIDYTNLSTAYRKLGDAKKSAYYQQLSAERDKDTLRCYMPNQTDNASLVKYVKEQRAYLAKHPDDNVQTVKMAANLLSLNKPAEALTYIDRAIAKEPFLMRSRFLRVEILQKLNRQSDAKPDLDEVLKNLERPSGSAVTAGGRLTLAARVVEFYRKTGNVDGQIKAYECLVRTGSAGEPQLYDLAQCYALKKQWAKAIETYTEALDYAVDNRPLIYEQRAKAHKALGHLKEAKADEAEAGRSRQRGQKL